MNRTQLGITYRTLAVLLCLLVSPLPQFAQSAQRAGAISAVRPSAMRNTALLKAKDQVNWNDLLKTDSGGRMRIGLDDGSILSVGTNSQLRVVRHDARLQQTQLELTYGKMRNQVAKLTRQGSQFEVRTPTAVAGVIGTDFYLEVTPNGTRLIVYEGVVLLTPIVAGAVAASQAVQVQGGYSADVDANGNISGPNIAPSSLEQQTISETSMEGVTTAKVAGATGGHLLRNVLIGVGLAGAVAGSAIVIKNSTGGGNNNGNNQQIPPR